MNEDGELVALRRAFRDLAADQEEVVARVAAEAEVRAGAAEANDAELRGLAEQIFECHRGRQCGTDWALTAP